MIDHSQKQCVNKLLIELSQSPEEMKGSGTGHISFKWLKLKNSISHFFLLSCLSS